MVNTLLPRVWPRTLVWAAALLAALALTHEAAHADGPLTAELYTSSGEPLNAYNLVVDSSLSSSYAPAAATVTGRFCNSEWAAGLVVSLLYLSACNALRPLRP